MRLQARQAGTGMSPAGEPPHLAKRTGCQLPMKEDDVMSTFTRDTESLR